MLKVKFQVNDEKIRRDFVQNIVPQALKSLSEETKPEWGKMTARHMVEHLYWAIGFSTGLVQSEFLSGDIPQERLKLFLYGDRPMTRNFINPIIGENLPELSFNGLEEAKEMLLGELGKYYSLLDSEPKAIKTHPVFGDLTMEEWERVHFKHCFHHLLQFGLIEEEKTT